MPRRSEPVGAAGGGHGRSGGAAGGPDEAGKAGTAGQRCPICGKPTQAATRPFCSKRCRDVDLNRWLSGTYVVPGAEAEDEGSE